MGSTAALLGHLEEVQRRLPLDGELSAALGAVADRLVAEADDSERLSNEQQGSERELNEHRTFMAGRAAGMRAEANRWRALAWSAQHGMPAEFVAPDADNFGYVAERGEPPRTSG